MAPTLVFALLVWVLVCLLLAPPAACTSSSQFQAIRATRIRALNATDVRNMGNPAAMSYTIDDYADLACKVDYSILDGPGKHLMGGVFLGDTIARETFVTQFVQDIASVASINETRVYVLEIAPGNVHFSWETTSVIILFRVLEKNATNALDTTDPTTVETLWLLTQQSQDSTSDLYTRPVTNAIDFLYGIVAITFDASIKLGYSISNVGGALVSADGTYLNLGANEYCKTASAAAGTYCEWEAWLLDDLATALGICPSRLRVLFVKSDGLDSVVVTFRVHPADGTCADATAVAAVFTNLASQVVDPASALYSGNVTLRTDPTWGVSNARGSLPYAAGTPRTRAGPYGAGAGRSLPPPFEGTPYGRCQATAACPRARELYDAAARSFDFDAQAFPRGVRDRADLFAPFENPRVGSQGWAYAWTDSGAPRGAHFDPWDPMLDALGVPAAVAAASELGGGYGNTGLVLDAQGRDRDLWVLAEEVGALEAELAWAQGAARDVARMGGTVRSRADARAVMDVHIKYLEDSLDALYDVQAGLQASQCAAWGPSAACYTPYKWYDDHDGSLAAATAAACPCSLLFNTSTGELSGAINATGTIMAMANGVEAAVWSFEQVRLGPEVTVTVVGQRALVLLSRSTMLLNTTIDAAAGTLGGMQGGAAVARDVSQALWDVPDIVGLTDLVTQNVAGALVAPSNNVNGPGAASLRYYLFTVTTSSDQVQESQQVCTHSPSAGQTLRGCFSLSLTLRGVTWRTQCVAHDTSPARLEAELAVAFNPADPSRPAALNTARRRPGFVSGAGLVSVVAATAPDSAGARCWGLRFDTHIGDVPQVTVDYSKLWVDTGVPTADVSTLMQGAALGGTWRLQFLDQSAPATTAPLAYNAEPEAVAAALRALPGVVSAVVARTLPGADCEDGLCGPGRTSGGGYVWTITVTTEVGNSVPVAPSESAVVQAEGAYSWPTTIPAALTGTGAAASLVKGFVDAPSAQSAQLNVSQPFSLAMGSGGGSYGGRGGTPRGDGGAAGGIVDGARTYGNLYNTNGLEFLWGGSGGARGGLLLPDVYRQEVRGNVSEGGHGGGAVELVASSDLTIGRLGSIHVDGGPGAEGFDSSGGGGSGGAILLSAGGSLLQLGQLTANGGDAGVADSARATAAGGGGGGGRVAMYAQSVVPLGGGSVQVYGGMCSAQLLGSAACDGGTAAETGTLYVDASPGTTFLTLAEQGYGVAAAGERSPGAQGTVGALYMERSGTAARVKVNGEVLDLPIVAADGPYLELSAASAPAGGARPDRWTFYVRVNRPPRPAGTPPPPIADWGGVVSMYPLDNFPTAAAPAVAQAAISVALTHEHGVRTAAPSSVQTVATQDAWTPLLEDVVGDRWYYVDVLIEWDASDNSRGTYDVRVDGVVRASAIAFNATGGGMSMVGVHVLTDSSVRMDEMYAGPDYTLHARCPATTSTGVLTEPQPPRGWDHVVQPLRRTETEPMQRHESFLSRSAVYSDPSGGGLAPFDGDGHVSYAVDAYLRNGYDYPSGPVTPQPTTIGIPAASLLRADTAVPSGGVAPAHDAPGGLGTGATAPLYWYFTVEDAATAAALARPDLARGVAACSQREGFPDWRFEGVALYGANITDGVEGWLPGELTLLQPKVLRGAAGEADAYVMWGTVEDDGRSLGMAGVAGADWPGGPFRFFRSFYPDGNATYDQTVNKDVNGSGVLVRTYYAETEYILPQPVMMPIWESVKGPNNTTDFGLSYHRAFYEPAYDDFHDIYLQRWRMEDVAWSINCVDRITGATTHVEEGVGTHAYCNMTTQYKVIIGQGDPIVQSRFKDPTADANNVWQPSSVPSVKAQPWKANYKDGVCGLRKLDDGYAWTDPHISTRPTPPDRSNCSNIADNPIHGTPPDKLIGDLRAVQRRLARYAGISRLTADLLDTDGRVAEVEGQLEGGLPLGDLYGGGDGGGGYGGGGRRQAGTFGWASGAAAVRAPAQTAVVPAKEFETALEHESRLHQYEEAYNDRAYYSLGCALDGDCPVNFRNQLSMR